MRVLPFLMLVGMFIVGCNTAEKAKKDLTSSTESTMNKTTERYNQVVEQRLGDFLKKASEDESVGILVKFESDVKDEWRSEIVELGVSIILENGALLTATANAKAIQLLAEKPYVKTIQRSQQRLTN